MVSENTPLADWVIADLRSGLGANPVHPNRRSNEMTPLKTSADDDILRWSFSMS
jgi:hypothetical protein